MNKGYYKQIQLSVGAVGWCSEPDMSMDVIEALPKSTAMDAGCLHRKLQVNRSSGTLVPRNACESLLFSI